MADVSMALLDWLLIKVVAQCQPTDCLESVGLQIYYFWKQNELSKQNVRKKPTHVTKMLTKIHARRVEKYFGSGRWWVAKQDIPRKKQELRKKQRQKEINTPRETSARVRSGTIYARVGGGLQHRRFHEKARTG